MDAARLIEALARFEAALPALVGGIAIADARWKPPDGAWSILEVVRHLGDEEVEDFRMRLRLTLEDPSAPWPPIDPEGAARARRYNEGNLAEAVERFCTERRASVQWLRGLRGPDWTRAHEMPRGGPLRAGDLLASWAAHDALHVRQIARRLYQLAARDGGTCGVAYAGTW